METNNFIEQLGLDRAISVFTDAKKVSESQNSVLTELKEKNFGVDSVYFCTDENNVSYPAVFIKKVSHFDTTVFAEIAKVQQKVWNYKKVLFLYVYSETDIKIYNCAEKPLIEKENFDFEREIKKIELESYKFSDKEDLQELNNLFSSIAIDTGIIWTIEEAATIRKKINLQRRVDKYLVESLINTANQLRTQGLSINFIHKIIMRSLFLLYLEDRKATDEVFYSNIRKGATSYFDILDNVEDTNSLFEKLDTHFNGNVFTLENEEDITVEQLQLIKKCFISGNDTTSQLNLYPNWKLFDFSIIQIELLSEIYENFLSEIDENSKKQTGSFYTPPALVELILNEKLPIHNKEESFNVKVLDPSCGSGIFLVESFKRLVKRHENHHNKKLTDFETLKKLLTDNIFGIEINSQSIKVAAFSLYLALVDNLDPKTIWQEKKHQLPYLINDSENKSTKKQGKNLYCRDTISINEEIEKIEFDLVVGNPPFGTTNLLPSVKNYNTEHNFAQEMVLSFLHKAIKFSANGEIVLIFNTKVLTNTGSKYQNFRKWLFNECYVEKIYNFSILRKIPKDFGGRLFEEASVPISIAFYKKEVPKNPSNRIVYYAPKTFIKSNIIEGISIDSTDVKYLPREECQKPTTKIWKVAMWGGTNDWELIQSISNKFELTIMDFLEENKLKFHFGSGLHAPSIKQIEEDKIFKPNKVIDLSKVERYYTSSNAVIPSDKIYRNINEKIFNPPYLLLKEGQKSKKEEKSKEFCVSYIDYNSFHTGYSISAKEKSEDNYLKVWCCLINSSFAKYFLSLTSSSWGIERERVQANETLTLPSLSNIKSNILRDITLLFDSLIVELKNDFHSNEISKIKNNINNLILESIFNLSKKQIWNIQDLINFSIDLFDNKQKSQALLPVSNILEYASVFCNEINNFLEEDSELFANAITYKIARFSPLMMIKISFEDTKKEVYESKEQLANEVKELDRHLWKKQSTNIFFRKKLNYKTGNDVYIIRPNQRRFWTKSMALEDASELILEILTGN